MLRVIFFILFYCVTTVAIAGDCPEEVRNLGAKDEWCDEHAYEQAAKAADKESNEIYKKLVSCIRSTDRLNEMYNDEAINELRDAQRAWLKYYEKHCGSAYTILTVGSPSTRMGMYQECRYNKIKQRIKELEDLYGYSESSK
jgi:uncharacterized protein YecT (DUF1311 family)